MPDPENVKIGNKQTKVKCFTYVIGGKQNKTFKNIQSQLESGKQKKKVNESKINQYNNFVEHKNIPFKDFKLETISKLQISDWKGKFNRAYDDLVPNDSWQEKSWLIMKRIVYTFYKKLVSYINRDFNNCICFCKFLILNHTLKSHESKELIDWDY